MSLNELAYCDSRNAPTHSSHFVPFFFGGGQKYVSLSNYNLDLSLCNFCFLSKVKYIYITVRFYTLAEIKNGPKESIAIPK